MATLQILVAFTTKTGGKGGGANTNFYVIFNGGLANY